MTLFTNEYNKLVLDEMNRSMRVIFFSLNDILIKDKLSNRDLKDVITE